MTRRVNGENKATNLQNEENKVKSLPRLTSIKSQILETSWSNLFIRLFEKLISKSFIEC